VIFKQNQVNKANSFLLVFKLILLATIVTVHDPYNFTTTRYHLEEHLVTKEDNQEVKLFSQK
jgi:hypothetical protein